MMRLGVLCDDRRAARLLPRWSHCAEFVVVRLSPAVDELLVGLRQFTLVERWEDLLLARQLDAILIGGFAEETLAAARHCAQAGIPLWVLPHPQQGLSFTYELNLAAEETNAPLRAVWLARLSPALRQAQRSWRAGADGDQYVEFTRRLPVGDHDTHTLEINQVDEPLLSDLDLLTWLFGRRTRITTIRTGIDGNRFRQQTVTLAADGAPEIVWTIEPASDATPSARCTIHRPGGALVLVEVDDEWRLQQPSVDLSFQAAPMDDAVPTKDTVPWLDAVTAFELFDGVSHSLERHRTIELNREAVSERAIFKTQMAAGGCAVLLGTLVLMLLYLMVAQLVPLGDTAWMALRLLVFTPLFLFLAAQLLLPLTRPAR